MRSSIAVLAASAMGAVAQSTSTVSLFLGGPSVSGQEWVGSVVTAGPSDTVYEVMCTASVCGTLSVPQTITIGPSHLNYNFVTETMGLEASASETCQISGTSSAVCQITLDLDIQLSGVASTRTSIALTTSFSGSELAGVPVELTAGVEKLSAATPASASGSSTASGSSSKASGSGTAASSSGSGSAGAVSATSTSGASPIKASGRGGGVLALVMFSAVSVSVGALMIL